MGTRVHLCGRVAITGDARTIDERELPGRQGRLAFAVLSLERFRAGRATPEPLTFV